MRRFSGRHIRLTKSTSINLRVSRWFPEMVILTVVLSCVGTYFFGQSLFEDSSFVAGVEPTKEVVATAAPVQKVRVRHKKKSMLGRDRAQPVGVATNKIEPNPQIVSQTLGTKDVSLRIASFKVVDDKAVVSYEIHNQNSSKAAAGSSWTALADGKSKENKLSWKAKRFTVKQAEVPIQEGREFSIIVRDDVAKASNSYKIRF